MRMHVNFGVNESSMCDYIFKEKCAILQFKKYIIYLVSSKVSTVILLLFVTKTVKYGNFIAMYLYFCHFILYKNLIVL